METLDGSLPAIYKVNGRTFATYWQVKDYIANNNWIITDYEIVETKKNLVVLINVTSK